MKVLLITGALAVPDALRDTIARGSTALEQRRAEDAGDAARDVDRVVFWGAPGDRAVAAAARAYLADPPAARGDLVVFVTPGEPAPAIAGLAPNELFVWPRDEDRLKMTFMTGA